MKKNSPENSPEHASNHSKAEGGPAVLRPTHQTIAYTPLLNKKKAAAKKKEEESEPDEMDR